MMAIQSICYHWLHMIIILELCFTFFGYWYSRLPQDTILWQVGLYLVSMIVWYLLPLIMPIALALIVIFGPLLVRAWFQSVEEERNALARSRRVAIRR